MKTIKKTLPLVYLVPCLLLATLSSCGEEETVHPISNTFLLAGDSEFGKTWQIQDIEISIGNLTPSPCITDNFITYFPNGNYEVNEGARKCDPNDPVGATGVWSFNQTETQLFIDFGDSTQTWEIISLNEASQRIAATFIEGERTYNLVHNF